MDVEAFEQESQTGGVPPGPPFFFSPAARAGFVSWHAGLVGVLQFGWLRCHQWVHFGGVTIASSVSAPRTSRGSRPAAGAEKVSVVREPFCQNRQPSTLGKPTTPEKARRRAVMATPCPRRPLFPRRRLSRAIASAWALPPQQAPLLVRACPRPPDRATREHHHVKEIGMTTGHRSQVRLMSQPSNQTRFFWTKRASCRGIEPRSRR